MKHIRNFIIQNMTQINKIILFKFFYTYMVSLELKLNSYIYIHII